MLLDFPVQLELQADQADLVASVLLSGQDLQEVLVVPVVLANLDHLAGPVRM